MENLWYYRGQSNHVQHRNLMEGSFFCAALLRADWYVSFFLPLPFLILPQWWGVLWFFHVLYSNSHSFVDLSILNALLLSLHNKNRHMTSIFQHNWYNAKHRVLYILFTSGIFFKNNIKYFSNLYAKTELLQQDLLSRDLPLLSMTFKAEKHCSILTYWATSSEEIKMRHRRSA